MNELPRKNQWIEIEELEDGLLVTQTRTGRKHRLTGTDKIVFQACDGKREWTDLCAELENTCGERAKSDFLTALRILSRAALLEFRLPSQFDFALKTKVGEETLLYTGSEEVYCLNPVATFVYDHCNGIATAEEVGEELGPGGLERVLLAWRSLQDRGLTVSALQAPEDDVFYEAGLETRSQAQKLHRRHFLKRFGLTAACLPLITATLVPRAAAAMSAPTCVNDSAPGGSCTDLNLPVPIVAPFSAIPMTCVACCGPRPGGSCGDPCGPGPSCTNTCFCMVIRCCNFACSAPCGVSGTCSDDLNLENRCYGDGTEPVCTNFNGDNVCRRNCDAARVAAGNNAPTPTTQYTCCEGCT